MDWNDESMGRGICFAAGGELEEADDHGEDDLALEEGELLADAEAGPLEESEELPCVDALLPAVGAEVLGVSPEVLAAVDVADGDGDGAAGGDGDAIDGLGLYGLPGDDGHHGVLAQRLLEHRLGVAQPPEVLVRRLLLEVRRREKRARLLEDPRLPLRVLRQL